MTVRVQYLRAAGLRNWLLLLVFFLSAVGAARADEVAPDVLVKRTTDEVLSILKQDKSAAGADRKKVLDLVQAKVLPHFDFTRMTRLAVGRYWRQATPAQQQELVEQFRSLLVRTYSTSLSAYKNQTIEFKPFRMGAGDTDVTVKTQVVQPGGQPIPIDYSMEKTPDGWKVYDVAIDGVSLVINYRGSFGEEIRRSGIDGLIKAMAQKNRDQGGNSNS